MGSSRRQNSILGQLLDLKEREVVVVDGGTVLRELGDFERGLLDAGAAVLPCAVGRHVDPGEASWKSSEGGGEWRWRADGMGVRF